MLDCRAGTLPHVGTPSLPWLSPSGGLWGHPAYGWDTDNISGITHHLQVALLPPLPRQGSSAGAGRVTQKVTKSWTGTGMWCGIIFLLVVSPSFGDLQSVELHRMLRKMLLGIKGKCGAH